MLSVVRYCWFTAMLTLFVTEVLTQGTVSIPTTNLSPQLLDTGFSLQCNIDNFQIAVNRALAWTKDGDLISWDRNIHGGFDGQARESAIGITTYYYLDFFQIAETHGGTYRCLIADGQPTSYTEIVYAEVMVHVPYFPQEPYPICSPNVPTIAVVGTEVTLSCTSLPGYPDEVILILQRVGQVLTAGGTVSGNMKELQTSYTITSADSGMSFACRMIGTGIYSTMSRTCNIGPLEVVEGLPRILPTSLAMYEGQDAIFTCELSSSGTIDWYTEPLTQSSRSTSNGMTFTLLNLQLSDNGKIIVCMATIGGAVVEDRANLYVYPPPPTRLLTTYQPIIFTIMKATIVPDEQNPPSMIILNTATQTTVNTVSSDMDITEDFVTTSIKTDQAQGSADLLFVVIALAISTSLLMCIVVTGIIALRIYRNRQNNHDNGTSQGHTDKEQPADQYEDLQRDTGEENRAYMWLNHRSEAATDDHEYADQIELQTPSEDAVHQYEVPKRRTDENTGQYEVPKERADENTAQVEFPKYIEITG